MRTAETLRTLALPAIALSCFSAEGAEPFRFVPGGQFRDFSAEKGKTIGFTFMVNDADVRANKCHLIWAGGFGNHKYPSQWGRLTLE